MPRERKIDPLPWRRAVRCEPASIGRASSTGTQVGTTSEVDERVPSKRSTGMVSEDVVSCRLWNLDVYVNVTATVAFTVRN